MDVFYVFLWMTKEIQPQPEKYIQLWSDRKKQKPLKMCAFIHRLAFIDIRLHMMNNNNIHNLFSGNFLYFLA